MTDTYEHRHTAREPEPAHLIDSRVLGSLFASAEMKAVFSDRAMVQAWLDTEVALVEAQVECGVAPAEAARDIAAAARSEEMDLAAIAAEIERTAHPLVPVIRVLAGLSGEAGAWVHYGATTQDVTDTGLVLQSRRGLDLVEARLRRFIDVLAELAERHRDLPMVGRTHAQHALPITLGFKFAVLLAESERHLERVKAVRPRVLVGQLGGAVGSMASFGPQGPEIARRMMDRLGLGTPDIAWHTARDNLTELTCVLAMLSATCGKIANEIRVLQRSEVAELEEPFALGKVGSSTMPHKRNPMFAEFAVSNAILNRHAPGDMLAAMVQEHERDMTMWGVEWSAVPQSFILAGGVLERTTTLLEGLVVHPDAIRRNLHQLGDLMLSEAAMMHLAGTLGKTEAHEVVYRASMSAWDSGRTLRETLLDDPEVSSRTDAAELEALLVPESYLGSCPALVDQVLTRHKLRLAEEESGV
ncbi:3-carboxy-cis,cis-muconate cycloisomerase [Pseudonocardia sulfidoxydans NBRC 16205]|uniref:3-carboxy-cis,cis-muconate cycloisomerase n=1 Tax=Pseudonocardia sulfidoxydans NBRC 16205 TaxID=1223511 RepID=A0A511DQ12_9PSEU|nr:adenylosuccinate lyase [Pseudonocardia sulfidoxydans]GEL26931.1 3-carboxy-cis,cis-muconate cycloisomerase [Pseudonocardia sulfidoxydans NBRC 16205]